MMRKRNVDLLNLLVDSVLALDPKCMTSDRIQMLINAQTEANEITEIDVCTMKDLLHLLHFILLHLLHLIFLHSLKPRELREKKRVYAVRTYSLSLELGKS